MSESGVRSPRSAKVLRRLAIGLLLSALLLFCAGCRPSQISPTLELQTEDYSAARKHFQTHLVVQEPAPQNGEVLRPPSGAQQVEYFPELHLQAWITPPSAPGTKKPAVLFLHGGFALGADDWDMTQPYRDAGYIVMTPALRGENGLPGEFSMFYNETTDVLAAAAYLAKLPDVDTNHLYVAGHSVGGTLTLLASLSSSRFKAAAAFSGAPDAVAWSKGQPEFVVFDSANPREFQMRSALAFAGGFKCPVRLYCGTEETFFATVGKQTSERAKAKGLDVEAITVPGDHFTAVPEEIKQSLQFFQSH